jgi:hypothetical protein
MPHNYRNGNSTHSHTTHLAAVYAAMNLGKSHGKTVIKFTLLLPHAEGRYNLH